MCMLAEAVGSGKNSSSILISSLNIGVSTLPLRKGPNKEELDSDLSKMLLGSNKLHCLSEFPYLNLKFKKNVANLMLL